MNTTVEPHALLKRRFGSREQETDASLIQAIALHQDEIAFTKLFERHAPCALALAQRIVQQNGCAEEVVQDAMFTVWRRASNFRRDGNAKAWIMTIVTNLALKKRTTERRCLKPHHCLKPSEGTSAHPTEAGEIMPLLKRRFNALSEIYRQVVVLYFWKGLTQDHIARLLKMPQRTVSTRLSKALVSLQGGLSQDGYS